MTTHRGSCLCGAVRFEVDGDLKGPDMCHCTQCRKSSSHVFVSTDVPRSALRMLAGDAALRWYPSSPKVRRGFCATCGASLFWSPVNRDWIGIAMGAFDSPTGTRIAVQGHVAEKGDYYDLDPGIPQR